MAKKKLTNKEKIEKLKGALCVLLDEHMQYMDNACHCEDYDEDDECGFCYAMKILEEIEEEQIWKVGD